MLKQTTLVAAGLQAVTALPVLSPALPTSAVANVPDTQVAAINQASLIAIEKSWLNLPMMCKARNAAFEPVVVGREELPTDISILYQQTVA